MPSDANEARPKTALVLAGGGSFGAIQVGMLRALVAHGLDVDMVVGCSVGALNGAYYAGMPNANGIEKLEAIWRGLHRRDIFPITWGSAFGFVRRRDFLVGTHGLRRLLDGHLPFRYLEQAAIPIHVVATDVLTGDAVVLSSGPATDAIIASSAVPAAFAPVRVGAQYLVDGAITCNTPVKVAVKLGAKRLVVLPTGFACALTSPPQGAIASALHALTLLIARQMVVELESIGDEVDYHIVPTLCPLAGSPYDFSQTSALIEQAAERTARWITNGRLYQRVIPQGLMPHRHG